MKICLLFLMIFYSNYAFSQLTDVFDDGNFSSNPAWTGSNSGNDFIILSNRLRSNSTTANSNFYLSTTNSLANNCKWEFWANLQISTSGANYADIYLVSDQLDLQSANINGYFIRIGNTEDEISLYKRSGSKASSVKIIDGIDGSVASSNNTVRIRVSRTAANVFTLERDLTATGTSYVTEGTVTDAAYTATTSFGILIQQSTATFFQKHYFDDFKITPLVSDNTAPKLISAIAIDSVTIEATFDEPADSISAKNNLNYTLNNGYGSPMSIVATADAAKYILKFSKGFITNSYIITAVNIKDRSNNVIAANNSAPFHYVKPYMAKRNDVVINEIFADPSPQIDLPGVEFIELFNSTTNTINLSGWKFADQNTVSTIANDSIAANEYVILCAKADTAEFKRFGKVIGLSPWPSLNNSGDIIKLVTQGDIIVDAVSYADTWYKNQAKKQGGWSLERVDPKSSCTGLFNWEASVDSTGGTPGKQNSVHQHNYDQIAFVTDSIKRLSDSTITIFFNKHADASSISANQFYLTPAAAVKNLAFDIDYKIATVVFNRLVPNTTYQLSISPLKDCSGTTLSTTKQPFTFSTPALPAPVTERTDTARIYITEVLADPSPEVNLPLSEFVEIYNPGKDTINLEGWTLNDPTTKAVFKKAFILPGQYLILCSAADTITYKTFGKTVGLSPWPSLNNTSDQLALKSFKNRVVDSVAYNDTWYKDTAKKPGGWSLEKIDPAMVLCNGFYTWAASVNSNGGTPGKLNSVNQTDYSKQASEITRIDITSDSTLRVSFSLIPDTVLVKSAYFSVDNAIGKARSVSFLPSYTKADLTFDKKFVEGINYQLRTDSIKTCTGRIITVSQNIASFSIPTVPENNYPLVINEIFADPSPGVGLPETEFVELFNPTNQTIALKDLIYEDETIKYIFKHGEIAANSYLILCPARDTLNFKPYGKVMGLSPWPTLNNDRDILILRNNKGREIHRVAYHAAWYKDNIKHNGGWALELIDPGAVCSGIQNWAASSDVKGGTPGAQNSQYKSNISTEPLKLLVAELTDSTTIRLTFNRAVDSISASPANKYFLNNGAGNPIAALPKSPDFNEVILKFPTAIARGNTYRITANNITDCAGMLISSNLNYADFILSHKIAKNDILINEILFNPRTNGADFVEIYNNSDRTLDLKELSISTTTEKDSLVSIKTVSPNQLLIKSHEYLVLTTSPDHVKQEYYTENPNAFLKMPAMPSFNDDAGAVVLLNGNTRIDQFNYTAKMHFPLIKNPEGVSLERSSFKLSANEPGNFRSAAGSIGYATPGYKNSQYMDEVPSEEEVFLTSKTFSPDNDGFEDVLQINYRFKKPGMVTNATIYNDKGVLISRLAKNLTISAEGVLYWNGLSEYNEKADMGIYMVYLEVFDTDGRVKKYRKNCALAAKINR